MRRKKNSVPVRVYKFGCPIGPTETCREAVEDQIFRAHRYRNDLVGIERERRAAWRELAAKLPAVVAIDAEIRALTDERDLLRDQIEQAKADQRSNIHVHPETRARIKSLTSKLKPLWDRRRAEARRGLKGSPEVAALDEHAAAERQRLRGDCEVYWGTYLLVEKAIDQASEGRDPRFKRFDGTGRVGVQLQKSPAGSQTREAGISQGLLPADIFAGTDTRLRIRPVPDDAWDAPRSLRRKLTRTEVSIRIGSKGNDPVWATFPVILHRPLPADGVVKWAWVQCKRIGRRKRWELCLSVEHEPPQRCPRDPDSMVAVDFGAKGAWAGHLVALAVGTDGRSHQLTEPVLVRHEKAGPRGRLRRTGRKITMSVREVLDHADSLRAINDRAFNAARDQLLGWIAARIDGGEGVPDWLIEGTRHAGQWRSPRRLASLVGSWRHRRFDGDDHLYEQLEEWRRQNAHLYQWECDERTRALAARKEHYRLWAHKLASEYGALVYENVNFSQPRRRAAPEDEPSHFPNRNRNALAPGHAREVVVHAFGRDVTKLAMAGRAKRCPECGGEAAREGQWLSCGKCGDFEDDFARCWNLLADADGDTSVLRENWQQAQKAGRELASQERKRPS